MSVVGAVILLGLPVVAAAWTVFMTRKTNRQVRRWKRGECMECGYDLRGATTCPECGARQVVVRPRDYKRRP